MKGKLSPNQFRLLAVVWIGVVFMVGICVFLGIFAALGGVQDFGLGGGDSADAAVTPQSLPTSLPTPIPATAGPSLTMAPTPPPNQDPSFGYGIQVQLHNDTPGTITMVQQIGFNWVKQQLRWKDLEPVPGQANWEALDNIFAPAASSGLNVMVSVVAAPAWSTANPPAEGTDAPPDDPAALANYLGTMVSRYRGAIHAVEVWNEQNLRREWNTAEGLSPQAYMDLLIPSVEAIRAADPNVIIISGALTPTGGDGGNQAIQDITYLEELIRLGMLDYVDCVGAHPSGYNLPPDLTYEAAVAGGLPAGTNFVGPFVNPHYSWSMNSLLHSYNAAIVAAGYDTPICVTEFGWATSEGMTGTPEEGREYALDNTLEEQSDYIVRAFELMHEWGFVKLAILWNLDFAPKSGLGAEHEQGLFSILTQQGSPRPAFEALKVMDKPQ